jgi:hypothetical protein
VKKRDGPARLGQLTLRGEKQHTSVVLHVESLRIGEKGLDVHSVEAADFAELCQADTWHAPRAAVLLPPVHPLVTKVNEAIPSLHVDCFVLSYASALRYSPRELVRHIIFIKNVLESGEV